MNSSGLRFLRPYLQKDVPAASKSAYLRFFSTSRAVCHRGLPLRSGNVAAYGKPFNAKTHITEFGTKKQERIDELKKVDALRWPRIESDSNTLRIADFHEKYSKLGIKQISNDVVKLNGVFVPRR
jgi:lysyl-tRNA synthetase class 2